MDSNQENVLNELINFEKNPDEIEEIPEILEKYLGNIARSGDIVHKWEQLKPFLKRKIELIATEFNETHPFNPELHQPNVKPFDFEEVKRNILNGIDSFTGAPFTIQRICELLTDPYRHYKRADKFLKGLEKNVMVISEEGDEHRSENGNTNSSSICLNSTFTLPSTSDSINQQQAASAFHNGYKDNETDFIHDNLSSHQQNTTTSTIQQLDSFTTVFVTSSQSSVSTSPLDRIASLPILESTATTTTNDHDLTTTNSYSTSSQQQQENIMPITNNNSTTEQQQQQDNSANKIQLEQNNTAATTTVEQHEIVDQTTVATNTSTTAISQQTTQLQLSDNVEPIYTDKDETPLSSLPLTNLEVQNNVNIIIEEQQQDEENKPNETITTPLVSITESTVEIVVQEQSAAAVESNIDQSNTNVNSLNEVVEQSQSNIVEEVEVSNDVSVDEKKPEEVEMKTPIKENQLNELKRSVSDSPDCESIKRFKSSTDNDESICESESDQSSEIIEEATIEHSGDKLLNQENFNEKINKLEKDEEVENNEQLVVEKLDENNVLKEEDSLSNNNNNQSLDENEVSSSETNQSESVITTTTTTIDEQPPQQTQEENNR